MEINLIKSQSITETKPQSAEMSQQQASTSECEKRRLQNIEDNKKVLADLLAVIFK